MAHSVRSAPGKVFWELFSGCAVLSTAFYDEGWWVGTPIDVADDPSYDLVNPQFFMLVIGLILEGRVAVLHLGPPDASFQKDQVELDSSLAELTVTLAKAQSRAGGYFQIEQPALSPMLKLPSVAALLDQADVFHAVRFLCADGAPWKNPTTIIANHSCILALAAGCPGCKTHIRLQGKAPDGRSWRSIASPYWPTFANQLARTWSWAKNSCRSASTSHLAGWAPGAAATVADAIDTIGFCPSGNRAPTVIGTRVAAGAQPTKRALPQLVPEGLGPLLHLQVVQSMEHPFAKRPRLTAPVEYALRNQLQPEECNAQRNDMLTALEELAKCMRKEDTEILALIDPFIMPVLAKRSLSFMREVSFASGWHDPMFIVDLAFGLPALGWAPRAPTMQTRFAPPEASIDDLSIGVEAHNSMIISRTVSSKDTDLDWAAWNKTQKELEADVLVGPFKCIGDIPVDKVRLLRRFGTWEQHGGAQGKSCRLIDDALEGGQNKASGSQFTHRPTDVDAWIAQLRAVQEAFPGDALMQFTSDFASAYKQVPGDPTLAGLAAISQWCPKSKKPVFFLGRTQFFGGKSCPVNFARVPDWGCHTMAVLGALPMSHCVDDMLVADRASTIHSGFRLWRGLARLAGWDIPDRKSPPPASSGRVLGVRSNLAATPAGCPVIEVAPDRVDQLLGMLDEIISSNRLSPGLAGKVWGRLQFASTQAYGRVGRAMLRAFSRRQHETGRQNLNPQLRASISWWKTNLPQLPPRPVPSGFTSRPVVISYSDGEGADGQVGIALWKQGKPIGRAGVIRIPPEVRARWDPTQKRSRFNDIFAVEAVGPLLVLHNFHPDLVGCLWLHFIDNAGALSSLVRGGSSVEYGDQITGLTWSRVVQVGCFPWFDRVDSASNPTDGLSRGRLQGPWRLEPIHLPSQLWSGQPGV